MSAIRFCHVRFGYEGHELLLDDLVLHLGVGWTGIVGPNGAGKTTLLRLATGELRPSSGTIGIDPPGTSVTLCEQRVDEPGPSILSLSAATDRESMRSLRRFGLDPYQVGRWKTLSPGERKRWQLAAALAVDADILALDEPTNHLDAATRDVVVGALRRFRGIGLLVSHDRALLDALTTKTVWVEHRAARVHDGNYSAARLHWEAEGEARRAARSIADAERARAAKLLADARRVESSAARSVSVSSRSKGPRDSDARSVGARNLASWAAARAGRVVSQRRRALSRAEAAASEIPVPKARGRSVFVDWEPPPRKWLAVLDGVDLRAGAKLVARNVRVAVGRDARIHVVGDNGAGKSTLLAAIVAAAAVPPERLLYLPQELDAVEGRTLVTEIANLQHDVRGRVGQLVAALGLDPSSALRSELPSPGEVRKLALALGLARRAWLVVLDEPTNHLDLPSIERLQAALADYPGALVLASHDAPFAAGLAAEVWDLGRNPLALGGSVERSPC